MDPGADPVESFLRAVRDAVSPLESSILRVTKDLQSHWVDSRKEAKENSLFGGPYGMAKKKVLHGKAAISAAGDVRKMGLLSEPTKALFGAFFRKPSGEDRGALAAEVVSHESCSNCFRFTVLWSLLFSNVVKVFPNSLRCVKRCFIKPCSQEDGELLSSPFCFEIKRKKPYSGASFDNGSALQEAESLPPELLLFFAFDSLIQNFEMREWSKSINSFVNRASWVLDRSKAIPGVIKERQAGVNVFLSNVGFAKVGGALDHFVRVAPSLNDESKEHEANTHIKEEGVDKEPDSNPSQKLCSNLLNIPLSNVERLRSTFPTVSLTELIEFLPQLGKSSSEHPDKKKLYSVQDFFRYTRTEGKRFFDELDRDGDGQVTLEDLEIAMRKRKLPRRYARDLLRRTKSNIFSKSIGWKQFLTFMEQKEPTILRAYTTLCLSKSGTLDKNQILTSLKSAGLPDNESNAAAMMRYLNSDTDESISYGHFRNFMLLLPSDRLEEDPRNVWFEAATLVAVPPPVEISTESVLKSALAGGLASALSTSVMYPIDTMKTRVQASALSFPELVSKLPEIGIRGLYRGSIPAVLGQFSSHGLRTGIFEACKLILTNVAPTLPDIQVQSTASFCSTFLGTAVRIPCEVLKQRLQAGLFDNVGEAIVGTLQQDGLRGFFRGTGATLCREVPFYVAGMSLYAEAKKTRVQASALSFPELVSKLPEIGIRGLYRGSIPAVLGQFSSHGLRTGIFEACKLILTNVAPTLPDIQVQSTASFCSTFLGTAVRIPCEVLKQRLQAGLFDNVGEAIVGTLQQDGLRGFFRGTGATLCREVPFYVAGMSLYAEAKKAAQTILKRELEPWETVAVGALSGGLAAVVTNPFDVMKTRMMTAPQGQPVSMRMVAFSVLQQEGPLGFFKGALPRFFWIAPLGAMNFAGYELAKKAMVEADRVDGEPFQEKKMAKAT